MTKKKAVLIGMLFLCVESALIDHVMDLQEKEESAANQWNAALIHEIDALHNNQ